MPELPEVQTVVRTLQPRLHGVRIDRVTLLRPDIVHPAGINLPKLLTGATIASITRRGKKIIFTLADSNRFIIHLGMTGRLTIEPPDLPRRPHTHLILDCGKHQLRFVDPRRFGGVTWLGDTQAPDENMGPEPLTLRPAQLARQLAKTTRPIKNALMDQSVIAGLGNIYVDESLFSAGIHPLVPANQLTAEQISGLNRSIKSTLNKALRHRGSTVRDYRDPDGNTGNFQKLHRVYDRAGKPCAHCKSPIHRIVLGGRSTHFCPKCQPPPKVK